jgi:N-acetylglucosamine-6-phosphate deacetylase
MTGFAAMEQCAVLIEGRRIADVFSQKRFEKKRFGPEVKRIDVAGSYIVPGFIDTHIHGFGGFGTEDCDASSLLEMSRILCQYGVTAFNPTIYPGERMLEAAACAAGAMGREEGARIMGLHLEGPFLSPARLGVQRPETVKAADPSLMERLWQAASGRIVNMTVAPEIKGMREIALYCIKKGILLQAGHTDACYEHMVEGMQAGILHATHLFNAMSKLDHHNPNAVGAALIHPEMSCEVIADGCHVHPDLFKLLLRDKPLNKIVLVTDALKSAGQKDPPFFANNEEVVFQDGVFRRKRDNVIAGSGLTMLRGVQNLRSFGFSLEDAVKTAGFNPAQVMGYTRKGAIIPGRDGDITVFNKDFEALLVLVEGVIKKNLF